ncbi:MAG: 23S rRNA (uracil-5-)-methyltransferase RumA, partial [Clostridiales bacterium]|nr:23S rRNA (uracil-5-)-methyltransferase RumA [Clostridiales bacterium]
ILPKVGNAGKSIFFVDPPRSGLGEKTALMITGFAPREIVYLSCNPQTLKEDIQTIIENGYKIVSAPPCDLFPETKHVETLVLFAAKQTR